MPVALHTVGPPDGDGLELLGLTMPDDVIAPVLVGSALAVGLPVPVLDAHDHILHIGAQGYHLLYLWGCPDQVLGSLLVVFLNGESGACLPWRPRSTLTRSPR